VQTIHSTCIAVIDDVLSGQNLPRAFAHYLPTDISASERGAIHDICYGVLRHLRLLDWQLDGVIEKPIKQYALRHLLRIALYQLRFTEAPVYAVVDEAVKTTATIDCEFAKGFVNALLRRLAQEPEQMPSDWEIKYSYPDWWVAEIKKNYRQHTEEILAAGNQHPPMTLRVNRRRTTRDAYQTLLHENEIDARIVGEDALQLIKPCNVQNLPRFYDGWVSVQDAGAQHAAHLLEVESGMRVLDACSAPGGKTTHILERAEVELIALDSDENRLLRVQQNLDRLQLRAQLMVADAADCASWWDGKVFDRILLDAPCSASGVVSRHPDSKWLRRSADIGAFAKTQQQLLSALWPLLKPGGLLLYATCSIFAEENQQCINAFLQASPAATIVPIEAQDRGTQNEDGWQLLPNANHLGFYYSRLQKK